MKLKDALSDLSHSTRGITRSCAAILICGIVISGILSLGVTPASSSDLDPDPIAAIYTRFLIHQELSIHDMEAVEELHELQQNLPPELSTIFIGEEDTWLPELTIAANTPSPPQGTRFALGLWSRRNLQVDTALTLFHEENVDHPHALVRQLELDTALKANKYSYLDSLEDDPEYQEAMEGIFQVTRGMQSGDWGMVLRNFLQAEYENIQLTPLVLSLISGGIWALLLLSLLPHRPSAIQWALSGLALILGWCSTWPTVISGMWMEETFGLEEGTEFLSTLFYMIVSVGFREELLKLLLYTPLLLYTRRPGRDLEALLFGALVGLGFAVEENINYFSQGWDGVAVSRFVSANMLHFLLTGVTALALTRAVRDPGRWAVDGLQTLLMAIGLHGLYNTLLSHPVPGLGDLSYFSGSALVGCAVLFFREIEGLSPVRARTITRTAAFCWGFCALFCIELGWASSRFAFDEALFWTGQAALAGIFTGYIFLHFIREPLQP